MKSRPLKYLYLYSWNERYWMMVRDVFLDEGTNCVTGVLKSP